MSYQSDYSGAQVDEAVGKALNPDATPTADSTNLVQSGGVASAVSAVQNTVSRRNLLDNWFFANPVNQRGLTSYSANNAYCIDRWKYYGTIPMTLQSDGIRLGDTTSNTVTYIRQFIDTPQLYAGKTLTYSVLVKDLSGTDNAKGFIRWYVNNVEQTASIIVGELTTLTLTIPSSQTSLCFDIGSYWNRAFTVVSAKLEIGDTQTLAHQESSVWVLNDILNYAEELAKCQRYLYILKLLRGSYGKIGVCNAYSTSVAIALIPVPVTMYADKAPDIGYNGLKLQNGTSRISVTGVTFQGICANAVFLELAATGLTAGANYILAADSSDVGWLRISFEL